MKKPRTIWGMEPMEWLRWLAGDEPYTAPAILVVMALAGALGHLYGIKVAFGIGVVAAVPITFLPAAIGLFRYCREQLSGKRPEAGWEEAWGELYRQTYRDRIRKYLCVIAVLALTGIAGSFAIMAIDNLAARTLLVPVTAYAYWRLYLLRWAGFHMRHDRDTNAVGNLP